jgi:hypothetical protein
MPKGSPRFTFAQREAGATLPQQMQPGEITRPLRVQLFKVVRDAIDVEYVRGEGNLVTGDWEEILWDLHIEFFVRMPDEFSSLWMMQEEALKAVFDKGTFAEIYGLMEYILRHHKRPKHFERTVNEILEKTQAAYRVFGGDTFAPYASEEEAAIVARAAEDLEGPQLEGVSRHYKAAMSALTKGDYAGSVRESIHAVESLTKLMTGEKTLQDGVVKLARQKHLHVTVQAALDKVAAWTNAVAGIRHANDAAAATPAVEEDDAVYMLAICGATLSYLKRRGEKAGLFGGQ